MFRAFLHLRLNNPVKQMMMGNYRPYTAQFYVYARNEKEVQELTKAINDFVRERYHSGTLVRADSLMKALVTFKNNPFVINFLRKPPQE